MRNVTVGVDGAVLTITIKLDEPGLRSSSGKSMVVASTEGQVDVPGTDLRLGLNVFRRVRP